MDAPYEFRKKCQRKDEKAIWIESKQIINPCNMGPFCWDISLTIWCTYRKLEARLAQNCLSIQNCMVNSNKDKITSSPSFVCKELLRIVRLEIIASYLCFDPFGVWTSITNLKVVQNSESGNPLEILVPNLTKSKHRLYTNKHKTGSFLLSIFFLQEAATNCDRGYFKLFKDPLGYL